MWSPGLLIRCTSGRCVRAIGVIGALIVPALLGACTTGMGAAVESIRQVVRPSAAPVTPLDPKFNYVRVTRGSHVALLWRGSTEQGANGLVEVYYSSSGEVIRILDGRIVGALGLQTEWRKVTLSPPQWRAAAEAPNGVPFERMRDVMPGYRSGVREDMTVQPIAAPRRTALRGIDAAALSWFEEHSRTAAAASARWSSDATTRPLPPARYAVDFSTTPEQVVYTEQCLAPDLCLTFQRWSAAQQQASAAAR
jgi:hypothetical protein